MLTATQGTPEWFLLRKFRVTGTGALDLWKREANLARTAIRVVNMKLERVFVLLSIKYMNEANIEIDEADAERTYTEEDLLPLSNQQLKSISRSKNLTVGGTKNALIARILASDGSYDVSPSVEVLLLKTWFMAPFKGTDATVAGTLNERNIFKKLPRFFEQKSLYRIEEMKEYGLLRSKGKFYAAFSPDGILVARFAGEEPFLALLEMKSRCTKTTETKEIALASNLGRFQVINLSQECTGGVFKHLIAEASHRAQLLHGMACGGLMNAFYVVASLTNIIRVVHIIVDKEDLDLYMAVLEGIHETANLRWVIGGKVPEFTEAELGYAVDLHTVRLIAKRLHRELEHQEGKTGKQNSCVWCCRLRHAPATAVTHSRLGRKTTKMCLHCKVPLCVVPRFNDMSCFYLWHTCAALNDPCTSVADGAVTVRGHSNRANPPPRRREEGGVEDDGAVQPPLTRARMAIISATSPAQPPLTRARMAIFDTTSRSQPPSTRMRVAIPTTASSTLKRRRRGGERR
jgi:hypothetical protein